MQHSLMGLAPKAVAGVHQASGAAGQLTVSAAGDILSNTKIMALGIPGTLGVILIVVGSVFTIRKVKEGIGEALLFQIGLIVLGVVIVLSVGIAAGITGVFVDNGVVDSRYYHEGVWGQ